MDTKLLRSPIVLKGFSLWNKLLDTLLGSTLGMLLRSTALGSKNSLGSVVVLDRILVLGAETILGNTIVLGTTCFGVVK